MPFGLIAAAVGGVASIVSGNKQKKAQEAANRANAEAQAAANRANAEAQQKQNEFNLKQADPAEIRRKFEAAGFNPVLGVSNWQPVQQTGFVPNQAAVSTPAFSTGIAEAGAVFGNYFDGIAKERSALTAAQQENKKLKDRLRDQMLRPAVGGIFGGGDKPLKSTVTVWGPDDEQFIGPMPTVNLWNAMTKDWVGMHPRTAKRLDLKDGDVIMAEDYEAFGGEVISEAMSMSDLANSLARGGLGDHLLPSTVGRGGYVPKQSVRPSTSSAPGYSRRESDFKKGLLNRPYLK